MSCKQVEISLVGFYSLVPINSVSSSSVATELISFLNAQNSGYPAVYQATCFRILPHSRELAL